MNKLGLLFLAVLVPTLVACSSDNGSPPAASTPPASAAAPESKPPSTPAASTQSEANTSDVSKAAVDACLAAVKAQTSEASMTVLSTEFSEANSLVMIGVGANNAPWRCLVSNDGSSAEVSFDGSDGDGVEEGASAPPPASSSDVSQAAIDACLGAVQAQTNEPNMTVLSTEFSEANSLVMVGVGPDQAPWRCLVSNDGSGAEASFAGSEGAA